MNTCINTCKQIFKKKLTNGIENIYLKVINYKASMNIKYNLRVFLIFLLYIQ